MGNTYSAAAIRTLATEGLGAALPAPRRYKNEESIMQRNLIRWWDQHCAYFGLPGMLLISIPNGGRRDKVTACLLKLEGCRAGAPDLLLAVARGKFHSLFIELKTPIGRIRPDQCKMLKHLETQGHLTAVCRSFEDARKVITEYLIQ